MRVKIRRLGKWVKGEASWNSAREFFFFFFFVFSRATPAAYGGSQARGLIGAIAPKPMPEPQQQGI